jgi:hypothetical protein
LLIYLGSILLENKSPAALATALAAALTFASALAAALTFATALASPPAEAARGTSTAPLAAALTFASALFFLAWTLSVHFSSPGGRSPGHISVHFSSPGRGSPGHVSIVLVVHLYYGNIYFTIGWRLPNQS